ncbi:LysR substrate-binding domain-containing protein, partial [Bacillus haynesii]|uniref:LysR substrate-binding domain-containing protein n=1 Tax=Bacillus haynesii TaxID=1925021 RepID=UPI002280B533
TEQDVTMADLQNQTWVTREVGSGTREYLNHVIRSNGLKVKSFLTISSNQGIKETLMTGIGLSLLSESVIERDVQHGNLSVIRLKNQTFNRTLSYIYSPVMQDKKNVKTFINALNKRTASE